jgi:hypothetical protein
LILLVPAFISAHTTLKLESYRIVVGETLNYKATWSSFTIGTATTHIDKNIYNIDSNACYKIDIAGQTNGLAKLFYLNDKWTSFIDKATLTTHESSRSIREGHYQLDEQVHFDQPNKKAEVKVLDKKTNAYKLKKIYNTPENIRDVVAGFMVVRLIDLSTYTKGDIITINGFNEDVVYKIDVVFLGEEYITTVNGKILCYKLNPVVPKNKVFSDRNSIAVWYSADKAQTIVRISAKMFVGNILIELQS